MLAVQHHHIEKVISDDLFNELYNLIAQVRVKSHPSNDSYIVSAVIHGSFVVDPKYSTKDMEDMVSKWFDIDYDMGG